MYFEGRQTSATTEGSDILKGLAIIGEIAAGQARYKTRGPSSKRELLWESEHSDGGKKSIIDLGGLHL